MHELSIAQAVLAIAKEHARGRRVTQVDVVVGDLRQVVPSALELAFELASAGTPLEGARLEVERVPCEARCRACGRESPFEAFPFRCEACGSLDYEIVAGEELYVDSLELDEVVAV